METGLTDFSTDSGLNIFKCADSPIHPPLGDIKILSIGIRARFSEIELNRLEKRCRQQMRYLLSH
jgi:hypothetical protein